MNKKTIISATDKTMRKLKTLSKKKKNTREGMTVTVKKLSSKAKHLAVTNKGNDLYKNKKTVISASDNTILKLKVSAKKKETVRGKLAVTAGELKLKATQLAKLAKEKESIRSRLEVTAKKLASTATEKESVRKKLVVFAKEKESIRRRLVVTAGNIRLKAKQLAVTAREKESIKRRLEVTDKQLAVTAREKESIRRNLAVTAKQLAIYAKQVESANKELKSLDLAKDEFVSLASHQLRTPLTSISWYTEMILNGDVGEVNPKQKKYLEEIYQGNKRMIDLVNVLLDISRIEMGTFVSESEETNIVEIVKSICDEQKFQIKDKNITLTENFNKDIPIFRTDKKFVRMIFQNLLSNSVKYTPQSGKIEFNISFENIAKTILIKISDTGYGIPKNQQNKIFTKFFRADNVQDKDTSGAGLGLYIVKSIVEKLSGKIWFESEENKGTTFFVTLPLGEIKKNK